MTTERLKPGWKRDVDGAVLDPAAWRNKYCIRSIVIPIASPAEMGKGSPEQWAALSASLKEAWVRSTEAANWALRRLLQNDVTRQPGETKCPKMPPIALYTERKGTHYWEGWSQSAAAVLRTVEAKYRASRYEVIWTGGASLPNVRYPYPYPVHNAAWKLTENPDGGLFFTFTLPSGRINVRLKGGSEYRKQLVSARWLIEYPDLRGEAAVYERGSGSNKQIVVKLVGWFPRQEQTESNGIMFVNTTAESFLVGMNARDEQLWIINGDRAKQWMTRSKKALRRVAEDLKYELRKPQREKRKTLEDMQVSAEKNRNRLKSFIDESAAQVVNHAKRRKLAKIVFNDSCREFFGDFQWYRLAELLEQKCNAAGIQFEKAKTYEEQDATTKPVGKRAKKTD